jgi:hypothetical protein
MLRVTTQFWALLILRFKPVDILLDRAMMRCRHLERWQSGRMRPT